MVPGSTEGLLELTLDVQLLSLFGCERCGTTATFAGNFDGVALHHTGVGHLHFVALDIHYLNEGDLVAVNFAVGNGSFAALVGNGAFQFGAIGLESEGCRLRTAATGNFGGPLTGDVRRKSSEAGAEQGHYGQDRSFHAEMVTEDTVVVTHLKKP
jgi:hypothetical protein